MAIYDGPAEVKVTKKVLTETVVDLVLDRNVSEHGNAEYTDVGSAASLAELKSRTDPTILVTTRPTESGS